MEDVPSFFYWKEVKENLYLLGFSLVVSGEKVIEEAEGCGRYV